MLIGDISDAIKNLPTEKIWEIYNGIRALPESVKRGVQNTYFWEDRVWSILEDKLKQEQKDKLKYAKRNHNKAVPLCYECKKFKGKVFSAIEDFDKKKVYCLGNNCQYYYDAGLRLECEYFEA